MSQNRYQQKVVNGRKDRIHRHMMEENLGRPLEKDEHVYHINADCKDNRIENLIIIKKIPRKVKFT